MTQDNKLLAFSIRSSAGLVEMLAKDLSPADLVHRPVDKANCAAWTIGHLTVAAKGMAARANIAGVPPLPEGFEARFGQKDGAPAASDFGDVSQLLPMLRKYTEIIASAVEKMTPEQLDHKLEKPMPIFATVGEMVAFIPIHNAMHAGQISTIRRSLGMPPVF